MLEVWSGKVLQYAAGGAGRCAQEPRQCRRDPASHLPMDHIQENARAGIIPAQGAMTDDTRLRILKILLRIFGVCSAAAFLAVLLPVDWMSSVHESIGLGEFPRAPVVDYLARSIAGLYGFHGVLVLLVSTDPIRYRPIVTYIALLNVIFGAMLIAIDLHARMPGWWTVSEGPPIALFGLILLLLNRFGSARHPTI